MSKWSRRILKFVCVAVMYTVTLLVFSHYFAAFWDVVLHEAWWMRIVFNLAFITVGVTLGIGVAELLMPDNPEEYRKYIRDGSRRDW